MESSTIGKLAEALSKAQGEMENAAKDKDNPFYKSTYADLASVWDACRLPLSKNGLAILQTFSIVEGKVILTTKLIHTSGEWMDSQVPVQPVKNDPQGMGSAMTYMRRFSLSAMVGIAPAEAPTRNDVDDDDDGNVASGKVVVPPTMSSGVFCHLPGCGEEVYLHRSGAGYMCPSWTPINNLHTKFPVAELKANQGPKNP